MLEVTCKCGKKYKVPETLAGKAVRCKLCSATIQVPKTETEMEEGGEYNLAGGEPARAAVSEPAEEQPAQSDLMTRVSGVDPRTKASNEGRMRVSIGRYYRGNPVVPVLAALVLVGGMVATSAGGKGRMGGGILVAAAVLFAVKAHLMTRTKFLNGDVCPGIVLGKNRVAVWTNMSASGGMKPAIKVINAPLGVAVGGRPEVGSPVAAVALYRGPIRDGAWADFMPEVVACGVDDEGVAAGALASIGKREWMALERGVKTLGDKPKPGLHRL
jgi:hypothetical protein